MIWIVLVIVVVVLLVIFGVVGFNRLRTADVGAQEALGGIDVQLTRRADLIPNLVETVKGYAAHEKGVFEEVTRARAGVQAAAAGDDVPAKAKADAELQGALINLNAVAENYPDLKANQNFLEPADPARRDREPDLVRPAVLQRRRGDAQQAGPDHPLDVLQRHGGRARARVLRRPGRTGAGADRAVLSATLRTPPARRGTAPRSAGRHAPPWVRRAPRCAGTSRP